MLFKLAFRNVRKHLKQSFLLGLSIALGYAGVLLLGGYMLRMERYLVTQGVYLNHTGHISIYRSQGLEKHLVNPFQFSLDLTQQTELSKILSKIPEIEFTGKFIHGQTLLTNGCQSYPVLLWASDSQTENRIRNHPEVVSRIPLLVKLYKGSGFWEGDVHSIVTTKRLSVLLKKPLVAGDATENIKARDLVISECSNRDSLKLMSEHSGVQLLGSTFEGGLAAIDTTIGGHFSTGLEFSEDNSIITSLEFAQRFYNTEQVTTMGVFLRDTRETRRVFSKLKELTRGLSVDLYKYDDAQVNPFYVGAMRFVYVMNLFFLILVCGVTLLSMVNTMQITIQERKNELGSILAIGFHRSFVVLMLSIENLMITVASLFSGGFIAFIAAIVVNSLKIKFDIVGNAEKLILVLKPELWFCVLIFVLFLLFNFISTALIANQKLKVKLMTLFEKKS